METRKCSRNEIPLYQSVSGASSTSCVYLTNLRYIYIQLVIGIAPTEQPSKQLAFYTSISVTDFALVDQNTGQWRRGN